MYKNTILFAVNANNDDFINSNIIYPNYTKYVKDNISYYVLNDVQYEPEYYEPSAVLTEALNKLSSDEFAFVRLGQDVEDTEIHGMIQNFNITINRSIDY